MLEGIILFYKTIINPAASFRKIKEERPFYPTLIYLTLYGFISFIYFSTNFGSFVSQLLSELPEGFQSFGESLVNSSLVKSPLLAIVFVIFPFFVTFVSAAIIDMICQVTINRTNGMSLFSSIGFASSPKFLFVLVSVLLMLIFKAPIPSSLSFIVLVWDAVLYVMAVSVNYDISLPKAFLIVAVPFVILVVLASLYMAIALSIAGGLGL